MAKIFSADYRSGTFIDSVNKIVGVPTSLSKLIRTEKGTALARVVNHDGVTYTTGSKSLSKFTIVAWIKQRTTDTDDRYGVAFIDGTQIIRREKSSTNYVNLFNLLTLGSISVPTSTSLNKWMQFVVTYDGVNMVSSVNNKQIVGFPSETTATLDFTSIIVGRGYHASRYSDSDILKFDVYDDVISDKEIELDYKALLDTQITEKEIRGFEYPKPTDLSYLKDTGLVAAYNMIPNGNTLVDISGNGYNGTISGALLTKEGMKFDGVDDYINTGVSTTTPITICFSGSINSNGYVFGGGVNQLYCRISSNTLLVMYYDTDFRAVANFRYLTSNRTNNFVFTCNGTTTKLYLNGQEQTSSGTSVSSLPNNTFQIMGSNYRAVYTQGNVNDFRIYNYAFTPEQAKAYHNSFVKTYINETMENHPVGDTNPKGWIAGTGAYKISESVDKGKFLENTTAGTTAIQSKQAYGEWEFDVYKGADTNSTTIPFISDRANATLDGANGYNFRVNSNEQVVLDLNNDGSHTAKIVTAASYIANNTDYRIKVARLKSEGVFKDISTLQVSNMVNRSSLGYTTFTSNGRYGFSATSNGSDIAIAGTADEISLTSSAKYLVEFDLKLNSGTAPDIALKANTGLTGNISNTVKTANGRNSIILTVTTTTTGALGFYNSSTATDYEVSGLTIRRIYDANSFAVFIKGGAYGNTETGWTLVDTTGGVGSNPVVDATYTTSEYFVADLDAGDRLANLKITNGVKQ